MVVRMVVLCLRNEERTSTTMTLRHGVVMWRMAFGRQHDQMKCVSWEGAIPAVADADGGGPRR